MWNRKIISFIFLLIIINYVNCGNVLCLMSVPSPSHHIWNRALMNGVAAKGHNLTILSPDIEINQPSNINYIHLENVYSSMYNGSDALDINAMVHEGLLESIQTYYAFSTISCEPILRSEGIKILLNYPRDFKFDAIIYDFTLGPCLIPFMHYFGYPPLISVSAFNNPPFTTQIVGGHKQYAYVPHYILNFDAEMNLYQRAKNSFIYILDSLYRYYISMPEIENFIRESKIFPKDTPSCIELEQLTSIMLLNTDAVVDFPEPLTPNVIPVGGLQIQEPKQLPNELLNFIEKSEKGAVLFSLGSNVRSDKLDANIQKMFLDAFEKLPQYNFLWKFESNELPYKLPSNVMIKAWMPQTDILAHPKTKAFMTHAGLLSSHEAAWYGVPMVSIPFYCDQHRNSYKSESAGVAIKLTFQSLTTESIYQALLNILTDPKYTRSAKILSARFRDQKEKPLDRAVWWVEWVMRNPSATHMKSPVLKLGIFKSNLIDIILIIILTIIAIIFFIRNKCIKRSAHGNNMKKTN